MPTYADIAFPTAVRRVFTYSVPAAMEGEVCPGIRVWVPLRRHMAIGVVVRVHRNEPDFRTRPVAKVLDPDPVLPEGLLRLTEWIHRFYYCSWGEAIQAALPAGLNFYSEKTARLHPAVYGQLPESLDRQERHILTTIEEQEAISLKEANSRWDAKTIQSLVGKKLLEIWEEPQMRMSPATDTLWEWSDPLVSPDAARELVRAHREEKKMYKWVKAVEALLDTDLPEFQKEMTSHPLLEYYTLNRIAEEGLITSREVETNDLSLKHAHDPGSIKTLNPEQQEAYSVISGAIEEGNYASFLLYGVTGSGKTEVYIHALKQVLEQGRGGLVLVPEIGLTPQIVERFYRVFGNDIAVLHSRLSNRERYDAWRALMNGEKHIAIGARSAVFAPVRNLGLIVVDEEHDASYKQEDPAPRYHARDVAVMRAHIGDAVVVMGSATPSMVTLQGAKKGKSRMLTLSERPLQSTMPEVKVLDLRQYRSAMKESLAIPLYNAVREALDRQQQVILLYNRRGYSFYIQCAACGHIPECPNCSVSLNWHKAKKQLRCHYCGYSLRQPKTCAECGEPAVGPMGGGTQQLEEELASLFPGAGVLRMDYDTTSGRDGYATILSRFGRKEADILVGTQIVGKGLDFPDVTVVGVIDADTELAFPSFRSSERMFQLLSQVAGRSGRSDKKGRVFFQTRQPDHPSLLAARDHDFRAFARRELSWRKTLLYPPYSRVIRFVFKGRDAQTVPGVAHRFTSVLTETVGSADSVAGPSPAAVVRVQKFYRWETILRIDPENGAGAIERLLDEVFRRYDREKPSGASSVRINVNVDALE